MPRTSHASSSHPPISYPRVFDPSSSTSSITHQRKPSLTNPMGWLSRNSTQSSSKTTKRASSPKSIELVSERTGPLGLGATVVRTPEEALQDTNVCLTRYTETKDEMGRKPKVFQNPSPISATLPLPLSSPPLPPTPDEHESDADTEDQDEYEEEKFRPIVGEPESLPPPSSPRTSSRSSPEHLSSQIPPLSSNPVPSEFRAMLLSEVPSGPVDLSNVMITLETCTQTYRTTMDTLTSRPSQLSAYLISLFPFRKRTYSNASSVYSTSSEEDLSTYRHHQGFISRSVSNIHIFLDRPSAPYAHILNYLRSPTPPSGIPETLPRGTKLHAQFRLDSLLELRDEAAYLELEPLVTLCNDEIKQGKLSLSLRLHTRNQSRTLQSSALNNDRCSVQSQQASVHAFPLDGQNTDTENGRLPNAFRRKKGVGSMTVRSPPTPQSWSADTRSSSASSTTSRNGVFNNPPAGWI